MMMSGKKLAIAVDIGTTTIAASLVDGETRERRAFTGRRNPQGAFGADVVTRLQAACESGKTLEALSVSLNGTLEQMVDELLETADASRHDLAALALAGNPAMEHFLLGLPVTSLAYPPFRPLFTEGRRLRTASLGWRRNLPAYLFPLPGGFVGGDLVAFLFGALPEDNAHPLPLAPHTLYLDLGTNGEIALVTHEQIYATSAAAGPAFEGGNLACGMSALPGAIERVEVAGDHLSLTTIGAQAPLGICGSGVIDTVAGLLREGVIDATGRLLPPDEIDSNLGTRVTAIEGIPCFILYRDASRMIYLSQDDIRQVQLAKAAIRAGMEILLQRAKITGEDLAGVVLTGSFGAVITPEDLKNVGIFPENMVKIASFIREGALAGIERALYVRDGFTAVDDFARQLRVVPLSGTPAFERHFLEQMNFPKP